MYKISSDVMPMSKKNLENTVSEDERSLTSYGGGKNSARVVELSTLSGSFDERVENVVGVRVKALAKNASRRRKSALVCHFYLLSDILGELKLIRKRSDKKTHEKLLLVQKGIHVVVFFPQIFILEFFLIIWKQ